MLDVIDLMIAGIVAFAFALGLAILLSKPMRQWANGNSGALNAFLGVLGLVLTVLIAFRVSASGERATAAVTPPQTPTETALVPPPADAIEPAAPVEPPVVARPDPAPIVAPQETAVACDPPVEVPGEAAVAASGPARVVVASFGADELTAAVESVVSQSEGLALAERDADVCAQDVQLSGAATLVERVESQADDLRILEAYGYGKDLARAPAEVRILKATARVEARFLRKGTRVLEERSVEQRLQMGGDSALAKADATERATRLAVEAVVDKILERR